MPEARGTPVDVVIFGLGNFASLVWYLLGHDSPHRVVAFTADRAYCTGSRLHGLPVLPFDSLGADFPAGQVSLLLALGGQHVNRLRAARFQEAKARGYGFASYISRRALVWPDLQLGEGGLLFEGCMVHPFARIGSNCVLRSGSHVSHHAVVGDHCFLAAHSVLAGGASLGQRCFLGLNSSVRDGVKVADRCLVAAGAAVTADTTDNGVYMGVPARRHETPADAFEP
jgi:sugar O-acyltransferase (sialic acid O-acetyltransferase NeuD family)